MTAGDRRAWGPVLTPEGARFRLWAPAADRLAVRVDGRDRPMDATGDGWFEATVPGAAAGTAYTFVLPDGALVPDPAARAQAGDVHGPSLVVDPAAYAWQATDWTGRPWHEAVVCELHVGAFTPEGTFRAAADRLPHLAEVGFTAVELMPVAQFSGSRGWGYDGVLPFAPHPAYGTPDDLRALVDTAHGLGLMVLLDVVYNHFGPDGNYIAAYAPHFFRADRQTPWGAAIAYERPAVRRFFVENALYWLEAFRLDGLRLDAIDQVRDPDSDVEILVEIARAVRATLPERHLTTEDSRNLTFLHERAADGRPVLYTAEWNDDFHNAAHVIATGETEGYYADFAEDRWPRFARTLAEGFGYQGEPSRHAGGTPRGVPSAHLPPVAFVDFLQNHDQIGNRAFGKRLIELAPRPLTRALSAILLLSPHIPLLFMGEEWGETRRFAFFTDFEGALADAVREGRRREFRNFADFAEPESRARIPDPNDPTTFAASKLDWSAAATPDGGDWLAWTGSLLATRRREVTPRLAATGGHAGRVVAAKDGLVAVDWRLAGADLRLRANLADTPGPTPPAPGRAIFGTPGPRLAPFSVLVTLEEHR